MDGSVVLDSAATGKAAAGSLFDGGVLPADVRAIYQQMLPHEVLDRIRQQENLREYARVYNSSVVMGLMIGQRLHSNGTLETAVQELLGGLPECFCPNPCKRLEMWRQDGEWQPSSHTGAYNTARQELSLKLVEQSSDRMFPQLTEHIAGCLPGVNRRAFFFDGTTVRLPHTEALREAYPPMANQHGKSHWPLVRMLVAHDAHTGLAMRPEWGPVNGSEAVSEQGLLEKPIDRLPSAAVVIGDANFGVFSVAWSVAQRSHPMLLRLTKARAQRLAGAEPLRDGIDRRITWKPSREDRRSHPELPADACVQGRPIVSKVQPSDGSGPVLPALFTTLDDDQNQLIAMYGTRWNIGVSSQGHIVQPVGDRPGPKDSGLVAGEAPWRESKTAEPSDNMLGKECAQRTRLQRAVHAEVASLHESPVAETVYNARKQQELAETSPTRQLSPAGVSAATWCEGRCGNWRSPRCPAKKARRGDAGYNREWEMLA